MRTEKAKKVGKNGQKWVNRVHVLVQVSVQGARKVQLSTSKDERI